MQIKPDPALVKKHYFIMIMTSSFILTIFLLLQLLIPLGNKVNPLEVAGVIWPICGLMIFLMWIIYAPMIRLWIKNLAYSIEGDRVVIFKGILTKKQQNLPYHMITDFMLQRSVFDRMLNIGTIRIQTAGQSANPTGYEGQLSGLLDWENLHKELRGKLSNLRQAADSSGSEHVEGDDKLGAILQELKSIRKALNK